MILFVCLFYVLQIELEHLMCPCLLFSDRTASEMESTLAPLYFWITVTRHRYSLMFILILWEFTQCVKTFNPSYPPYPFSFHLTLRFFILLFFLFLSPTEACSVLIGHRLILLSPRLGDSHGRGSGNTVRARGSSL